LEVTATDTAALGSGGQRGLSRNRRYGFTAFRDGYVEDDAVRVLMGEVAINAARHDRTIEPILGLFGGHYVRVTVVVRKSKTGAGHSRENIGYRVRYDDVPYRFERHPSPENLKRASGPRWIGRVWNDTICARLTEEEAIRTCMPTQADIRKGKELGLKWSAYDQHCSERELRRSVRHISGAARLMAKDHLLLAFKGLQKFAGVKFTPSMRNLMYGLRKRGYEAARLPDYNNNLIATSAPFEIVMEIFRGLGPQRLEGMNVTKSPLEADQLNDSTADEADEGPADDGL
jgi:tRNA G26 N,N-dimethylase Trm1